MDETGNEEEPNNRQQRLDQEPRHETNEEYLDQLRLNMERMRRNIDRLKSNLERVRASQFQKGTIPNPIEPASYLLELEWGGDGGNQLENLLAMVHNSSNQENIDAIVCVGRNLSDDALDRILITMKEKLSGKLKRLRFYSRERGVEEMRNFNAVSLSAFAKVASIPSLIDLRMYSVTLTTQQNDEATHDGATSSGDFTALASALRFHPNLQEFRLVDCQVNITEEQDWRNSCPLESILKALGTIPTLRRIELTATSSLLPARNDGFRGYLLGNLQSESVPRFLDRCPLLTELVLQNISFDLQSLLLSLAHHPALQEVVLSGVLPATTSGFQSLATALRENNMLKFMRIQLDKFMHTPPPQNEEAGVIKTCQAHFLLPVAKALETNRTLKCLEITGHLKSSTEPLTTKQKAAKKQLQDSFLHMLQENNFVLEQLSVEEKMLLDDDFLDKIHFYLQLNRLGRNSLLGRNQDDGQIGSREEWLEAILKAIRLSSAHSLSCIFYFLLLNPSLLFATS